MGEEKRFEWQDGKPTEPGDYHLRWKDGHESVHSVYTSGYTSEARELWIDQGPMRVAKIVAWAHVATPEDVCALVARAEDDDERLLDAVLASRCGCDSAGCSCGAVMAPCHHCTEHWNDQDGVDSAVHYLDVFSRQIDRVTDDWIKTSNILTAERRAHEKAKAEVKRLQKELDLAHEAAANLCPVWPDPMEELRAIDQEAR